MKPTVSKSYSVSTPSQARIVPTQQRKENGGEPHVSHKLSRLTKLQRATLWCALVMGVFYTIVRLWVLFFLDSASAPPALGLLPLLIIFCIAIPLGWRSALAFAIAVVMLHTFVYVRASDHSGQPLNIRIIFQIILLATAFIAGYMADITRKAQQEVRTRLEVERALRDSEKRFVLALEGTNEVIWDWHIPEDHLYLSQQWWKILNLPIPEKEGPTFLLHQASWLERVHENDKDQVRDSFEQVQTNGCSHLESEHRLKKADGTYCWVLARALLQRNETGEVIRMTGSITDITKLKQTQLALQHAHDEAIKANQAKSQFLANMSHELRTPLNAIIGFTRLVRRKGKNVLPSRQLENLEKVITSSNHLLALINDILDLSKIESECMKLNIETFELSKLIDELQDTMKPLFEALGNNFTITLTTPMFEVRGDRMRLKQVLLNLLSNANKFTEHGELGLIVELKEHIVQFHVKDTGIGIDAETLSHLFEPFVQANASIAQRYGGTGLGLVLSRRFCQLMGGDLNVKSTPGVGSTFTAWFPQRRESRLEHDRTHG